MKCNKCEHCFNYLCDRCRDIPYVSSNDLFTEYQKERLFLLVSEWYLEWFDSLNDNGSFKKSLKDLNLRILKEKIK